ncbi:MAG TPA: hypothetical protein VHA53_12695, partial [Nitrolancea sp.]|nr:hypothetical protein [Nitrolancea sp.]
MPTSIIDDVQDHLAHLTSLEHARRLFSDLNYDPVLHQPISRSGWSERARDGLHGDPEIIARGGDFVVIYSRLKDHRLDRGAEREAVTRLT